MRGSRSVVVAAVLGAALAAVSAGAATVEKGPRFTLRAWDRQIPDASLRFIVLRNWNREAVLDKETGLVWQRSPATNAVVWTDALQACRSASTGGRFGWRLPQEEELASLAVPDPTEASVPELPTGSPFLVASGTTFWTATVYEANNADAWAIEFGSQISFMGQSTSENFWCVRGGHGAQNPQ
jgi:hypothetical protein